MTPASPKPNKTKDPNPGIPIYGCGRFNTLVLETVQAHILTSIQNTFNDFSQRAKM